MMFKNGNHNRQNQGGGDQEMADMFNLNSNVNSSRHTESLNLNLPLVKQSSTRTLNFGINMENSKTIGGGTNKFKKNPVMGSEYFQDEYY
jgi:hypothetical protein